MLPEYFAIIGAVIASMGGFYYLYETIVGKAQPNRITWLLWGLFPMTIFFAQRVQGVQGLSWTSFVSGTIPLLVVTASFFNKKAYWKSRKRDYVCMAIGFVGILLWGITDSPNLAILFAIIADLAAGIPTYIKAKRHPETESWQAFAICSVGYGICLLAVQEWNFQNVAFVVYIFAASVILTFLSSRKPSKNSLTAMSSTKHNYPWNKPS